MLLEQREQTYEAVDELCPASRPANISSIVWIVPKSHQGCCQISSEGGDSSIGSSPSQSKANVPGICDSSSRAFILPTHSSKANRHQKLLTGPGTINCGLMIVIRRASKKICGHINSSPPLLPTSSITLRTSSSSNIGPMPSHRAIFLSRSHTSPMSTAPERYSGCDCMKSQVTLAESRVFRLLDEQLLGEVSVEIRPFASRAVSKASSLLLPLFLREAEDFRAGRAGGGSCVGLSTNFGGWSDVGEVEAVARRISFSVCAR